MVSSVAEFAVKGLSSEAGSNFDGLSWFVSGDYPCTCVGWNIYSNNLTVTKSLFSGETETTNAPNLFEHHHMLVQDATMH
ncbi:hypothetical protein YC2023_062733 [Brassica napus]